MEVSNIKNRHLNRVVGREQYIHGAPLAIGTTLQHTRIRQLTDTGRVYGGHQPSPLPQLEL